MNPNLPAIIYIFGFALVVWLLYLLIEVAKYVHAWPF